MNHGLRANGHKIWAPEMIPKGTATSRLSILYPEGRSEVLPMIMMALASAMNLPPTRFATHDTKREEDQLRVEPLEDEGQLEEEVGLLNRLDSSRPRHVVADQVRHEGSGHGHGHAREEDCEESWQVSTAPTGSTGRDSRIHLT